MKKVFACLAGILFSSALFISCSKFCIFTDVPLESDMDTVQSILDKNRIKHTTFKTASFFESIDINDPENIADLIINEKADALGEQLYKDSFFFFHKNNSMEFQTRINFFDGKCSNINLLWHVKSNPSLRTGYAAAENFIPYIKRLFPDKKLEAADDNSGWGELYKMNLSDSETITIRIDQETIHCDIENTELQNKYKSLRAAVNAIVEDRK